MDRLHANRQRAKSLGLLFRLAGEAGKIQHFTAVPKHENQGPYACRLCFGTRGIVEWAHSKPGRGSLVLRTQVSARGVNVFLHDGRGHIAPDHLVGQNEPRGAFDLKSLGQFVIRLENGAHLFARHMC